MLPINVMLPASTAAPTTTDGGALESSVLGSEALFPADASFAAALARVQVDATAVGVNAAALANQAALAASDGLLEASASDAASPAASGTLLPWVGSGLPLAGLQDALADASDSLDAELPTLADTELLVQQPVLSTLPGFTAALPPSNNLGAALPVVGTAGGGLAGTGVGVATLAGGAASAPVPVATTDPALATTLDRSVVGTSSALPGLQDSNAAAAALQAVTAARGEGLARAAEFGDALRSAAIPEAVLVPAAPAAVADGSTGRPAVPQWTTTIATPMDHPKWDSALGERVLFMVKQDLQVAEIRLNPAHLGPMEVRLSVHQDQVHAVLTASHALTRDAMEAALPRLRDMLADVGLTLAGANVASYSSGEQQRGGDHANPGHEGAGNGSAEPGLAGGEVRLAETPLAGRGLLDVFA